MCADHKCETEVTQDNKFCYKATTYETTKILAKKLNIPEDKYIVTYQSRLTNKWLSPFTDEVLESLPKDDKKNVLVFSPAFTADCLETIIEIGDEYKEFILSLLREREDRQGKASRSKECVVDRLRTTRIGTKISPNTLP